MSQQDSPKSPLSRLAERDEAALAELYDRHAPAILGMLMHILRDRQAAEDVLEETFVKIWADAKKLSRERSSASASLFLVARAKAVERTHAGKKSAASGARFDHKLFLRFPPAGSVSRLDEKRPLLQKVIRQLPKPQKAALDLAVFSGLSESEIAERLGEPSAKVRAGLLAAMRFLRHRLAAVMGTWAANI